MDFRQKEQIEREGRRNTDVRRCDNVTGWRDAYGDVDLPMEMSINGG